jgi:hypothetical protein
VRTAASVQLLRALPGWTVKALVPRPLADAMASFVEAALTELTSTLGDQTLGELKWYFNRCRNTAARCRSRTRSSGATKRRSAHHAIGTFRRTR